MSEAISEQRALTPEESGFIAGLIENQSSLITNVIARVLGDEYDFLLEECISETYLTACNRFEVVKNHESPEAWIIVVAKLTAKRMIQRHNRHKIRTSFEELPEQIDKNDVAEEALYNIWIEEKVPELLISRLSKQEKIVYQKIFIEHKPQKVIAEELDITVNTVSVIKNHLVEKIKYDIKKKNF